MNKKKDATTETDNLKETLNSEPTEMQVGGGSGITKEELNKHIDDIINKPVVPLGAEATAGVDLIDSTNRTYLFDCKEMLVKYGFNEETAEQKALKFLEMSIDLATITSTEDFKNVLDKIDSEIGLGGNIKEVPETYLAMALDLMRDSDKDTIVRTFNRFLEVELKVESEKDSIIEGYFLPKCGDIFIKVFEALKSDKPQEIITAARELSIYAKSKI